MSDPVPSLRPRSTAGSGADRVPSALRQETERALYTSSFLGKAFGDCPPTACNESFLEGSYPGPGPHMSRPEFRNNDLGDVEAQVGKLLECEMDELPDLTNAEKIMTDFKLDEAGPCI